MNNHYKKVASVLRDGTKKHTIQSKAIATGRTLKYIIYPYQRDKRECVLENVCLCTHSHSLLALFLGTFQRAYYSLD
jgi:hypothetical protein